MKFDKFYDFFKGFEDCYVVIGGNAADFWLERDNQTFRATQDYDIVVIFENSNGAFSEKFVSFIKENNYITSEVGKSEDKKKVYYRFQLPKESELGDIPKQIELFSRIPLQYELNLPTETTPLHYEDGPSLSAIGLDDDYYNLLKNCHFKEGSVSVLSIPGLIYFKAKAHLDVQKRVENGETITHRANKTKHFNDVCRLCDLLTNNNDFNATVVPKSCQEDLKKFIDLVENTDQSVYKAKFKNVSGFDLTREDVVNALKSLLPSNA